MKHNPLRGFRARSEYLAAAGMLQQEEEESPKSWIEFNEKWIGLPIHPATNLPHALLNYQDDAATYRGKDLIVNKANKIGMTEAILRDVAYKGTYGDCVSYQIMLGAQRREIALENMKRLQRIFEGSSRLRAKIMERRQSRLILTNNTEYLIMPRSPAAIRGWPRLKYAFLDEAAHYGLLDDEEFLAATTSRLSNTDGYLRIVSTPKGQRGFFFRTAMSAQTDPSSPFAYRHWDYNVSLGILVTKEFIEKERQRLGPLFAQEYECAFLAAQNAAISQSDIESAKEDYEPEVW